MDSELSFYARLDTYDTHVNLLEVLHGKPAMATVGLFSGGFYTGKPQVQDHSHLLGLRPKNQTVSTTPLKLLFRYTAEGYLLRALQPVDKQILAGGIGRPTCNDR